MFFSYAICFGLASYYRNITASENHADAETGTNDATHHCNYINHVSSWKAVRLLAVVLSGGLSGFLLKSSDNLFWAATTELALIYHSMILSLVALILSSVFIAFFEGRKTSTVSDQLTGGDIVSPIIFAIPAIAIVWSGLLAFACFVSALAKEFAPPLLTVGGGDHIGGRYMLNNAAQATLFAMLGIVVVLLTIVIHHLRRLNS
ncbi:hypothetical protein AX17_007442 [Amanita inopinata Kibby_2008]|nr:hypothetical protein AX17_007442 [Amanita inopinata Kibby_2008]